MWQKASARDAAGTSPGGACAGRSRSDSSIPLTASGRAPSAQRYPVHQRTRKGAPQGRPRVVVGRNGMLASRWFSRCLASRECESLARALRSCSETPACGFVVGHGGPAEPARTFLRPAEPGRWKARFHDGYNDLNESQINAMHLEIPLGAIVTERNAGNDKAILPAEEGTLRIPKVAPCFTLALWKHLCALQDTPRWVRQRECSGTRVGGARCLRRDFL